MGKRCIALNGKLVEIWSRALYIIRSMHIWSGLCACIYPCKHELMYLLGHAGLIINNLYLHKSQMHVVQSICDVMLKFSHSILYVMGVCCMYFYWMSLS